MISCWFFKGSFFVLTFVLYYFLFSFCFVGCVLFSKIKLFLVLVCLATFWCVIVSFLDLVIVIKRINYPVLSWFNPVWVPWVFFLSHAVSLWFMVFSKLRWFVWLLYNSIPTGLKEKWKLVVACLSCC